MKLNAYPIESYSTGDYVFASRNGVPGILIDPTTLPSSGVGTVDTFYTSDGTLPSGRQVSMDGYSLSFIDGSGYLFHSKFPATGLDSNFSFYAEQATTQADKVFDISTGIGVAVQVYGDRSTKFNNGIGIGITPSSSYGAYINGYTVGVISTNVNGKAGSFTSINNIALEVATGAHKAITAISSGDSTIYGRNSYNGNGVAGISDSGYGVKGESKNNVGVIGESVDTYGGYFAGESGVLAEGNIYGVDAIGSTAGVYAYSNSTGWGVIPYENSGSSGALNCQGKALFNGTAATGSSLVQVDSTTQGVLLPRMTTTQRDAIGTPATGLEIYNTTTNRKEVYNGAYWQGISTRFLQVMHGSFGPTSGQTVAFGQATNAPTVATNAYFEITMRGNGVIRGCDLNMLVGGTAGTNENWSLYVRHQGTDYLVATVGSTAVVRKFSNTTLNIPYVDGDIVRMIYVNPTWVTPPTSVTAAGFLTLQ
jgi:hypothetical protein